MNVLKPWKDSLRQSFTTIAYLIDILTLEYHQITPTVNIKSKQHESGTTIAHLPAYSGDQLLTLTGENAKLTAHAAAAARHTQ